jgi:beta-lactamase regulating signal transducer with metallopeptidase domain
VTALGAYLLTPIALPVATPAVMLMEPLAKPFSVPAPALTVTMTQPLAKPFFVTAPSLPASPLTAPAPPVLARTAPVPTAAHLDLESVLLSLWATGFLIIVLRWYVRWSRVRALLRKATAVQVDAPVAVKFSPSRLEPGLVGILRPVILLPQGIEQQLSPVELKAVLAHELCHWRRHDNLLAAIHMLVEALFWFFPLVWWLGARLNAERERACDESVLADGNDPQMYAEGILKVCRVYLQSPLACVAGVSGAGLKKRIDAIMENRLIPQLNAARKFVLGTSAAAALVLPLVLGLAAVPVAQMQAKAAPIPPAQRSADDAATTRVGTALNESNGNNAPSLETSSALQSQSEAIAKGQTLAPPSPDLSRLLPNQTLATPMVVASSDPRAQLSNTSPAGALDDQAGVQPTMHDPSAGPVQAALGTPPAAPPRLDPNEPHKITRCKNVPNGTGSCDLVTLASAAAPGLGSDSRDRTELAMKCWLGLVGYEGCWKSLCGDDHAGVLERVEYLGRTAAGADIYQVRYRHRVTLAYGIVPDPKGTADQYLVKATDPYWTKRKISPRAAPILIYARPENAPDAGCGVGFYDFN